MPFNREEWEKAQKEKRTVKRTYARHQKLLRELRRGTTKFRSNPKLQLELRRVVALCTKLGIHINSALQDEIIRDVMES